MKYDFKRNHELEDLYDFDSLRNCCIDYEEMFYMCIRIIGQYIDSRLEKLENRLMKRQEICDKNRIH